MSDKTPDYIKEGEGFVDIELSRGLQIGAAKVGTVRMREPTVNDQLAADASKGTDAEKELAMMANLCELAPADIKAMPLRDYKRLQTAYLGFID